jgi:hypothetical protein
MRRFYDENLLGNKLVALGIVILFNVVVSFAPALLGIFFLMIPCALILTFTNDKLV